MILSRVATDEGAEVVGDHRRRVATIADLTEPCHPDQQPLPEPVPVGRDAIVAHAFPTETHALATDVGTNAPDLHPQEAPGTAKETPHA